MLPQATLAVKKMTLNHYVILWYVDHVEGDKRIRNAINISINIIMCGGKMQSFLIGDVTARPEHIMYRIFAPFLVWNKNSFLAGKNLIGAIIR